MADTNFNGFPTTETVPNTDIILVGNETNGVRNATKANFLKELIALTTIEGAAITPADGITITTSRCMKSPWFGFVSLGFTPASNKAAYDYICTIPFNVGASEFIPMFDLNTGATVWAYAYEHSIRCRSALTAGHTYAFTQMFI